MNQVINSLVTNLNSTGRGFCDYAGNMFVQSSVLIILLLIIDFLLRKRVRAVFRYCIWMLVFVKLILPPTLSLPTGFGYWCGGFLTANKIATRPISVITATGITPINPYEESEISAIPPQTEPAPSIAVASASAPTAISNLPSLTWQGIVFLTWLVGVLVFSVLLIQRMFFVRALLVQSKPAKGRLPDTLEQCRRQVDIRRSIGLKLSSNLQSPAVCGLFKPIILIPTTLLEKLSRDKLRVVLIHELAHIKRGDLWVNLAQTFLQIAYFYNPFVWLANAVVRRIREQAVDETVLVALGTEAKSYSNTLIDIAEMVFWKTNLSLRLIGVAESKKALHRRIKHMLTRPIPKSAKLGVVGLLAVFTIAAVLLPMAAAEDRGQKADGRMEKQFVKKLPNGVTAELVGICEHPSSGKKWWRPDGSFMSNTPYETTGGGVDVSQEGYAEYEFTARVAGSSDYDMTWSVLNGTKSTYTGHPLDENGERVSDLEAYTANQPREKDSTTVRIGIASGPWDMAMSIKTISEATMSIGDIEVGFGTPYEKDGYSYIPVTYLKSDFEDKAVRLVAVDENGKEHPTGCTGSGGNKLSIRTYTLALKLEDIDHFRFKARPYQWVTFKNVSLQPGVKTDVQVESGAGAGAPQEISDSLPNIFIMGPSQSTFSIFNEVVSLSRDWVWNKTGRQHDKKSYDEIFDGTHNRSANDILVLVFSLDRKDRIPTEYEDLLPKRWQEIEAELKQGRTVELSGKARGLNVILLAAPKMDQLKKTITTSKFLNNPKSFIKTDGKDCDVGIEDFKINFEPDRMVYNVVASIHNYGKVTSPKFIVNFYYGDPDQVKPMTHGAGPIKPDGVWNERSMPFGLKEGANEILVVLDPANLVEETNEANNRASMNIVVEDGKIIQKSVSFESAIEKGTGDAIKRPRAKSLRVYQVNRSVGDFPEKEDFSTPEAAYAAINRVSASGDPSGWQRVSVKELAQRFARQEDRGKTEVEPEWAKVLLNARILEVHVFKAMRAMVIAKLPQEVSSKPIRSPIDIRYLELENGRWLNTGNDRVWTIEEARAKFSAAFDKFEEEATKDEKLKKEEHSAEVREAAKQLFEKIRSANYRRILKHRDGKRIFWWNRDWWKEFPTWNYYRVHTDYPSFVQWCCETFKENPIVSVELGKVFMTEKEKIPYAKSDLPTVPYKVTLKDGALLEGNLPFEYTTAYKKIGPHWHGIGGIDWHLRK